MLATTAFVFAAFVLRAVLSAMYAAALQLQDGSNCSGPYNRCGECHNAFTHMSVWMAYTPEFESTIVLISSPLALLVALWGMTSKHMLKLLKKGQQDKEHTMAFMQPKKNPQQASS
jgi:hypothetical protein